MAASQRPVSCGKAGCPVLVDGRCLEGFDDICEECPNVGCVSADEEGGPIWEEDLPARQEVREEVVEDRPLGEQLPLGEALRVYEADALLARRPTRVACVVADNDAGKTTLIATLFECFQTGPFAGFGFAGSETLVGFERRCHEARVESGRRKADTTRTKQDEGLGFLHLRLAGRLGAKTDLLLADRAGEGYKAIRNSSQALRELEELGRADVVLFLLDCERLLDPAERMSLRYDVFTTVKAVIDGDVLRFGATILLALTKVDLLVDHPSACDAERMFDDLCDDLRVVSGAASIGKARIASRPDDERTAHAHGLDALLTEMLRRVDPPKPTTPRPLPADARPFETFDLTYDGPRP